jgi:hypothetical protein
MSDSDDDVGPSIPVGFVPPTDDDESQSIGQKRGANGGSAQPVKKRKPKGATQRARSFAIAQRSQFVSPECIFLAFIRTLIITVLEDEALHLSRLPSCELYEAR